MLDFQKYQGKKITIALSGGVDSTSLFFYLKEEAERCGFQLFALHVEHGIRGEDSKADARFVKDLCKKLSVPLFFYEIDCLKKAKEEKMSVETAAREGRREIFASLVREGKTDYVATAHHSCDEAETLIFRLCRGTSLTGACAMREEEGYLLRPFLTWSREKILRYAKEKEIPYRIDESNFSLAYTRNKIRLEVLPKLEEICDGATENIAKFSLLAQEDEDYLQRASEKLLSVVPPAWTEDTGIRLSLEKEKPLFYRGVVTAMKMLGVYRDYTFQHLKEVYSLLEKQTGTRVSLKNGVVAVRFYDTIAFEREGDAELEWQVIFSDTEGECEGVSLRYDKDALPKDVFLRTAKEGDVFRKFGGGSKTLKKYFIEKKIPQGIRKTLPLLVDGEDKIYAVCGVEIADEIKVTEGTKHIGYILLQKRREER